MDGATHEEEAGGLAASGVEVVMERYWEACSVVVELWRSGVYVGRIARRAGLGHGYIYGMLRDAGENPKQRLFLGLDPDFRFGCGTVSPGPVAAP